MKPTTTMATSCTALLLLASCGGGSDAGGVQADGDVEAFCDVLRESEEQEEVDLSEDFDAGMAQLREFRDAAPSVVHSDLDVLIGKFEELNDLEAASTGDDEEDFAAAFAIILDPQFIAASENLEAFGVEECGLEPSADDGFSVDGTDDGSVEIVESGDGEVEAATSDDGLIREAADVADPLFDPVFEDDVIDPTTASIDGAAYFLDVNYTDSTWRTRLNSWSTGGGTDIDFSVGGTDITPDDAAEICSAIAEYLTSVDTSGSIVVTTRTHNDDGSFGDEADVLSGTVAGGC